MAEVSESYVINSLKPIQIAYAKINSTIHVTSCAEETKMKRRNILPCRIHIP